MNAQEYLNYVIDPTLAMMQKEGNYCTDSARMLLLATCAIESDLGLYSRQVKGPAVGHFQVEPPTIKDIVQNWDDYHEMIPIIKQLAPLYNFGDILIIECEVNPRLSCLFARAKYAMVPKALPSSGDRLGLYNYYKKYYNSTLGASTVEKFYAAWDKHELDRVAL